MRWNTEVIKGILEGALPDASIASGPPNGDWDTELVVVRVGDGSACVFAMNTGSSACIENPQDTEAEILFATYDSKDGMGNASPEDMKVVADVVQALNDAGYPSTQEGWKAHF